MVERTMEPSGSQFDVRVARGESNIETVRGICWDEKNSAIGLIAPLVSEHGHGDQDRGSLSDELSSTRRHGFLGWNLRGQTPVFRQREIHPELLDSASMQVLSSPSLMLNAQAGGTALLTQAIWTVDWRNDLATDPQYDHHTKLRPAPGQCILRT